MIGLSLIPPIYRWGAGAALIGVILTGAAALGYQKGESSVHRDWDASKAAIVLSEKAAVDARLASNAKTATEQAGFNIAIKKAKNEDLAPIVAAIAADRVRIGPALCPGRFTAAPEAASAGRSDGADHVAVGIYDQAERDFKALEVDVAKSLATGRAAQSFITENGLAP